MSGTKAGGAKAAATNKLKYGDRFFAEIGAKGGRNGHTGGFASNKVGKDGLTGWQRAKIVGVKGGRIGGRIGKRGKAFHNTEKVIKNGKEVTRINVKYIPSE